MLRTACRARAAWPVRVRLASSPRLTSRTWKPRFSMCQRPREWSNSNSAFAVVRERLVIA